MYCVKERSGAVVKCFESGFGWKEAMRVCDLLRMKVNIGDRERKSREH